MVDIASFWGAYGSDPVHVGPPWTTVRQPHHVELLVRISMLFYLFGICLCFVPFVLGCVCGLTCQIGPPTSWGFSDLFGMLFGYCATGAVPVVGGVSGPLGTTVPWGDSPRGQGGPWAPPPCSRHPFWEFVGVCEKLLFRFVKKLSGLMLSFIFLMGWFIICYLNP